MPKEDSLVGYLYDISGGEFKTTRVQLNTDGSYKNMFAPASGKRICLLKVGVYHAAATANYATSMGFAASGASAADPLRDRRHQGGDLR